MARSESDREKIFGDPSDAVMRGLIRKIDDITNPIYEQTHRDTYMCIIARVNDYGQYMLRELFENNGETKTHRLTVRKNRLMFLVLIDASDDGTLRQISSQMVSRATDIITFPSQVF